MKQPRPEKLPHLAPAELAVMKALWAGGRLSAREIHERVAPRSGWAYSTTRTIVERLVGKGLVARRSFHGLHLHEATLSRPAGLAAFVKEFAEKVLDLDTVPVAALFAQSEALSAEELSELEALLGTLPEERRGRRR
jgi:BlaI family penicillinase repressor